MKNERCVWKMLFGLIAVVLATVMSGSAQAQMTGFYAGALAGHASGSYKSDASPSIDHSPSGQFLGVQLGWNQHSGSLILGVDGDLAFASVKGNDSITASGFKSDVSSDMNYLGTLRARVGGMAGSTMIYGTAGFALANLDNKLLVTAGSTEVGRDKKSSTHTGWTVGAGVEFPITPKISLAGDYLHIDMQKEQVTMHIGTFPFTDKGDLNLNTFRVGLNFRF